MITPVTWNGTKVDVQARLVPRFFWSTASIDVFLDGKCILRTGGQLKVTGGHSVTFSHSGSHHRAELSWGAGFFWSFPYKLRIDSIPVSESRVYVRNWPLSLIPSFFLGIAFLMFLHFVLHIPRNQKTFPPNAGRDSVPIEKPAGHL